MTAEKLLGGLRSSGFGAGRDGSVSGKMWDQGLKSVSSFLCGTWTHSPFPIETSTQMLGLASARAWSDSLEVG